MLGAKDKENQPEKVRDCYADATPPSRSITALIKSVSEITPIGFFASSTYETRQAELASQSHFNNP